MDDAEAHEWAAIFSSDRSDLVSAMAARASALGLTQDEHGAALVWKRGGDEACRWLFVDDPSDITSIRAIYASDDNVASPSCYIVVRQPDASDRRGDIVYDIFRLSPESYLWHFNRVYGPPS